MSKDLQPSSFGRFEIQEVIGRGAMATVYRAFDPQIDREVAIKVLLRPFLADPEYQARFLTEARAAGNLASHPNIATIYDVGEENGTPFIAMEYVAGNNLADSLADQGRLSVEDGVQVAIQVADALAYAHDHGVVHRDIKASNILYLANSDEIRITDFGIAHRLDNSPPDASQAGLIIGTPQSMSPEQADGAPVDGRSDIFSAGVLMYELISGTKPFAGDSLTQLMQQIREQDPRPLRVLDPKIPASLTRLIEKCLEKQPRYRYQSARELAAALRRVQRDLSAEHHHKEPAVVSFRVRWTTFMTLLVSAVMLTAIYTVYQRQNQAMTQMVLDYGASLATVVAAESAEAILLNDNILLDSYVSDIQARREFSQVIITDRDGRVRSASDDSIVGKPYPRPSNQVRGISVLGAKLYEQQSNADQQSLLIETPVLYANKRIGTLYLGLSRHRLQDVMEFTLWTLGLLVIVTAATSILVAYSTSKAIERPLHQLKQAFKELRQQNLDYRISGHRKDELGQLFYEFDEMAQAIEQQRLLESKPDTKDQETEQQ